MKPASQDISAFDFRELLQRERAWIDGKQSSSQSPVPPSPTADKAEAGSGAATSPAASTASADDPLTVQQSTLTGEPWLAFTTRDSFGFAASGGGIRSATFNLGLLQALDQKGLLRHADYISTVSGGGYAGGFMTAWRHHNPPSKTCLPQPENPVQPPRPAPKLPSENREPAQIRHLREFSRFLMPRLGLFRYDTWGVIVTILGGMLPALAAACALTAAAIAAWLLCARAVVDGEDLLRDIADFLLVRAQGITTPGVVVVGVAGVVTLGLGLLFGRAAKDSLRAAWSPCVTVLGALALGLALAIPFIPTLHHWGKNLAAALSTGGFSPALFIRAFALGALTLVVLGFGTRGFRGPRGTDRSGVLAALCVATAMAAAVLWYFLLLKLEGASSLAGDIKKTFDLTSITWVKKDSDLTVATAGGAYGPAVVWSLLILVMFVGRALAARFPGRKIHWSANIDSVIALCLGAVLVWTGFAVLWHIAREILESTAPAQVVQGTGAGAVVSGGLFAALQKWLREPKVETNASALLPRVFAIIKPIVPQVLAVLAVVGIFFLVCLGLQYAINEEFLSQVFFGTAAVILSTLLIFDPARMGMHDCYRSRIARAFLGGARASDKHFHRSTLEDEADDITFEQLAEKRREHSQGKRTMQLVCCTGNNLAGDVMANLYRGGRSVTLSAAGLAVGNVANGPSAIRLSSALTASAAAFNSQMGRVSMDFGPAVAFLMCALNCRLGLWVRHPVNPNTGARLLPGLPFYAEMLGLTACDRNFTPEGRDADNPDQRDTHLTRAVHKFRDIHLSDGGHFENLALYELIRRHCRYIIVSDCAADPTLAFDDLANAVRTIREDFGVEIDLDISPLIPDEHGRAKQHAVVGTVHYDGPGGMDKGTIIYFKPALTGDEPLDVTQYRTRNPDFPHEGTGDQFYEEAQWESYRRLGEHSGHVVFAPFEARVPRRSSSDTNPPLAVKARRYADAAHADIREVENAFLSVSRRWHVAPESQESTFLALTERCATVENIVRTDAPDYVRAEFFPEVGLEPKETPTPENEARVLPILMQVAQLMEDVWLGTDLDRFWSHPLNEGWMNYFHRWAATPTFRRWWPVLRPIYSNGFREFVNQRFHLGYGDVNPTSSTRFELVPATDFTGLAWEQWKRRQPLGTAAATPLAAGERALEFRLTMEAAGEFPARTLVVGILIYTLGDTSTVKWNSRNFFVPPALSGSGFIARFLEQIVRYFAEAPETSLCALAVSFERERKRPDPATRLRRLQEISFYKSRGFHSLEPAIDDEPFILRRPSVTETLAKGIGLAPQHLTAGWTDLNSPAREPVI